MYMYCMYTLYVFSLFITYSFKLSQPACSHREMDRTNFLCSRCWNLWWFILYFTSPSFVVHTLRLSSPCSLRMAAIFCPHAKTTTPHFLSCEIPTLIRGDFNILINNPTFSSACRVLYLTSSLGISQLTHFPMHKYRNLLDSVFWLYSVSDFINSSLLHSDPNPLSFTIKHS